jgi:hypothetical protein
MAYRRIRSACVGAANLGFRLVFEGRCGSLGGWIWYCGEAIMSENVHRSMEDELTMHSGSRCWT